MIYRSYDIANHEGRHVARSLVDESATTITGVNLLVLIHAIDVMWDVLDGTMEAPTWLTDWMEQDSNNITVDSDVWICVSDLPPDILGTIQDAVLTNAR